MEGLRVLEANLASITEFLDASSHLYIRSCPSVGRMVELSGGWSGTRFFQTLKMSPFLYENHWSSPTLTLLYVLGVLGVLYVLHVLHMLHVLYVLNMPMDASLACWALFHDSRHGRR